MSVATEFIKKSQILYLATIGLDGNPKVRPFQFMLEDGRKLYFCTSNQKEVYKEIKKQAYVEFSALGENYSWIRFKGKVVFSDNLSIKGKIQEHSSLVKSIYKTPDNPVFEIFYLENAVATIADFSGNPPEVFNL